MHSFQCLITLYNVPYVVAGCARRLHCFLQSLVALFTLNTAALCIPPMFGFIICCFMFGGNTVHKADSVFCYTVMSKY